MGSGTSEIRPTLFTVMTFIATPERRQALHSTSPARGVRPVIRAAVVIALALVGAVIGWTVGGSLSVSYVSTTSMVINPLPGNPLFDDSVADLETLQTEAQRARSDAVLSAVVDQLGGTVGRSVLQRRVTVAVAPGSEVLEVSYRGGTADASATTAEALAVATLRDREQRASNFLAAQINEVGEAIRSTRKALRNTSDQADEQRLARRLVLLNSQVRDLKDQSLNPGAVIGVTTTQVSSKTVKAVFASAGLVAGVLLGLRLLLWVSRRSRSVKV